MSGNNKITNNAIQFLDELYRDLVPYPLKSEQAMLLAAEYADKSIKIAIQWGDLTPTEATEVAIGFCNKLATPLG